MSISSEITRLQTLRNNIRTKLIALGVISDSSASLNDCYTGINSIAKKTSQTYTPTTSNQTIASGQYLSGAQTISGDANLVAGNIKQGVSIFGVSGSHAGQKTEQSKTVTPTAGGFTVSPDSGKVLSSVIINGDADLVAGNVKNGINIFDIVGNCKEYKVAKGTFILSDKWAATIDHGLGTQNIILLIQRISADGTSIEHESNTNAFSLFISPLLIPNASQKYIAPNTSNEKQLIQIGFEVSISTNTTHLYTDAGYYIPQNINASKGITAISDNSISVGVYNRFRGSYTYNWTVIGLMNGV